MTERSPRTRVGRGVTLALELVVLLVICAGTGCFLIIDVPLTLAVGWVAFLARVLPRVQLSAWAIATFLVAGLGVALLGHRFASWLHRSRRREESAATPIAGAWRWRWTFTGVALLVLTFANGIAAVGAFHQAVWFAESRPLVESTMDLYRDTDRATEFCAVGWSAAAGAALDPERAMEAIWSSERFVRVSERWNALPRVDVNGKLQAILILPRDPADLDRVGGFVCSDGRIASRPRAAALAGELRQIH